MNTAELLFTNHCGTTGGIPLLGNCFSAMEKLVHIVVHWDSLGDKFEITFELVSPVEKLK